MQTKELYNPFLEQVISKPSGFFKVKEKFGISEMEIKAAFVAFHSITEETKLKDFQFRCLHSILNTKYLLKRKKVVDDDCCSFCKEEVETMDHLLFECPVSQTFWSDFQFFWKETTTITIHLSLKEVILGISAKSELLNHLVLLGKRYLFCSSKHSESPNFKRFLSLCKRIYMIEHEIAKNKQRLDKFQKKWKSLELVLDAAESTG